MPLFCGRLLRADEWTRHLLGVEYDFQCLTADLLGSIVSLQLSATNRSKHVASTFDLRSLFLGECLNSLRGLAATTTIRLSSNSTAPKSSRKLAGKPRFLVDGLRLRGLSEIRSNEVDCCACEALRGATANNLKKSDTKGIIYGSGRPPDQTCSFGCFCTLPPAEAWKPQSSPRSRPDD